MASSRQIDMDNLVVMGSSRHQHKATVSRRAISHQEVVMALPLHMVSHMVMVPLANNLVRVDSYSKISFDGMIL